jgi:hypothetical protein
VGDVKPWWVVVMGGVAVSFSCGSPPRAKAPADLPPPEYEKPRGYDLPEATTTAAALEPDAGDISTQRRQDATAR